MSIEKTINELELLKKNTFSYMTANQAFTTAINTMRKYQKIQEIVSDFREYQKGISCGFGGATYMQMVSEVIEDGRT